VAGERMGNGIQTNTFFVATNISTRMCLTRPEVSSGKGVVSAVASAISCVHAVPGEKKLKGKHLSTSILTAKSSRTLKRQQHRETATAAVEHIEVGGQKGKSCLCRTKSCGLTRNRTTGLSPPSLISSLSTKIVLCSQSKHSNSALM